MKLRNLFFWSLPEDMHRQPTYELLNFDIASVY